MIYFAYGSNMDPSQMSDRAIRYDRLFLAKLPKHRLVFNKRSSRNPQAVFANVVRDRKSDVWGIAYEGITLRGIDLLDQYEGAPRHYRRTWRIIRGEDDERIRATVYVAQPQWVVEGMNPPEYYLEKLLRASSLLPPWYVLELQSVEVAAC